MVAGRAGKSYMRRGFYLEGYKFFLYVSLPIVASWYYSIPENQKASIEYWKFVAYPPADPGTSKKADEVAALIEEDREKQRKHEEALGVIQEQMKKLNQDAKKQEQLNMETREEEEHSSSPPRWYSRLRFWSKQK